MTSLRRKKWEQVCPFFNSKRFQNVCMNEKKKEEKYYTYGVLSTYNAR